MTEPFKGHNCTKRASQPTKTLRIDRREIQAMPEELIHLSLLDVHDDCDPQCYRWAIRAGGGIVHHPYGITTIYQAPDGNKECEQDAVVDAFAGQELLDSSYITVSKYRRALCTGAKPWSFFGPAMAFAVITGEIYAAKHTGSMTKDAEGKTIKAQEYLQAAYIMKYYDCQGNFCGSRYAPSVHYWGGSAPVDILVKNYSGIIGKIYDYRTKEMRKAECCPAKLLKIKTVGV